MSIRTTRVIAWSNRESKKTARLYGGDDSMAPVVGRFLLLERGDGLR